MKRSRAFLIGAASCVSVASSIGIAVTPAQSAIPVFDVSNYTQNLLQASRALEQINHQLKSLQNQATMIESMARNLKTIDFPELSNINSSLQQIDRLMGEARAIDFKVDQLDAQFGGLFPDADRRSSTDQRVASARMRLQGAMEGFRHSMAIQSQVVSNISKDAEVLNELALRSQGAKGALQVEQATNQLLALSAKQQMQLEDLLSAQFRSEAVERARQVQAEDEARSATRRFLGSGEAYSSTHE